MVKAPVLVCPFCGGNMLQLYPMLVWECVGKDVDLPDFDCTTEWDDFIKMGAHLTGEDEGEFFTEKPSRLPVDGPVYGVQSHAVGTLLKARDLVVKYEGETIELVSVDDTPDPERWRAIPWGCIWFPNMDEERDG